VRGRRHSLRRTPRNLDKVPRTRFPSFRRRRICV
jgi:hypothetical protein